MPFSFSETLAGDSVMFPTSKSGLFTKTDSPKSRNMATRTPQSDTDSEPMMWEEQPARPELVNLESDAELVEVPVVYVADTPVAPLAPLTREIGTNTAEDEDPVEEPERTIGVDTRSQPEPSDDAVVPSIQHHAANLRAFPTDTEGPSEAHTTHPEPEHTTTIPASICAEPDYIKFCLNDFHGMVEYNFDAIGDRIEELIMETAELRERDVKKEDHLKALEARLMGVEWGAYHACQTATSLDAAVKSAIAALLAGLAPPPF